MRRLSGEGRRSRPRIGSRGNGIGGIGDGLEHRPDILIRRVAAVGAGGGFPVFELIGNLKLPRHAIAFRPPLFSCARLSSRPTADRPSVELTSNVIPFLSSVIPPICRQVTDAAAIASVLGMGGKRKNAK